MLKSSLPAFVAAVLLVASTTFAAAQQPAPTQPKEPVISVNGTARVERTPDYVDVAVGVVADEKTASEAQGAANHTMESAIAAIKALSLPEQDLQTGSVELSPRYEQHQNYNEIPKVIGYQAVITIRVRTSDLKSPSKIIDAALGAGCNRVDYVSFGIKEALAAREEAIKLATQAAQRKAKVLAEALEMRLVRVETASTTSQMGGWYGGYRYASNMMAQSASVEPSQPSGDDQSPVVPGKVEIWADANVSFIATPLK
jgi:uncharacterized protein YggE